MFNRLREQRYINRHIKLPLHALLERLKVIRQNSSCLAICPATTGFNWMGVNRAAHNLFPDATFEFPQYYSHSVYSAQELAEIARYIAELRFKTIVLNGFPGYFAVFAKQLKAADSDLLTAVIYHGSLSELAGNEHLRTNFAALVDLLNEKIVGRIGFVKKGLPEFFEKMYGVPAVQIFLPPPVVENSLKPQEFSDGKLHIGVFASNQLRKNVHNMVAAALMTENSVVHIFESNEMDIYRQQHRFVLHPSNLPRNEFLGLLGSMDINLYNTYTETWGQIVVESLSMGVPCLTNNSSGVLDLSPELKKMLVVDEHDNPAALARAIIITMQQKAIILRLSKPYLAEIESNSTESIQKLAEK